MKLTERDIEIINVCNSGATINQIAKAFFENGSYNAALKRLVKLEKSKFIKSTIQPTLGIKCYYTKKPPSFHALVIKDIQLILWGKYDYFKSDHKWGKTRIDCFVRLKNQKLLFFEIDIFNRTSQQKINYIQQGISQTKLSGDIWIVQSTQVRRKFDGAKIIQINQINSLALFYS